jgi:multidrug resistance efflux pump
LVDIARKPPKKTKRYVYAGIGVAALAVLTVWIRTLEPAAPTVERATLWIDTVRKGTMVRQVRAPGTLVPEHVRIITALTAGRVEQKIATVGQTVQPNTPLLEMSNPDVQLQALEADRSLAQAEANLVSLKSNLQTQRMQQAATIATVQAQYNDAKRQAAVFESLDKKGMSSANEVAKARDAVNELEARLKIEKDRLALLERTVGEQLKLEEANVARQRSVAQFQQDRIASMKVKAGSEGQLQEMNWEVGQWANPGAILAKIAQPGRLKAVLRIPETQAKDVHIGKPA